MNRRQLIRTAVGAGAAAASLPVMAKLVQANDRAYGQTSCSPINAPEWKEPPLDTRTPEQVVEDSQQNWAEGIVRDFLGEHTKYHKSAYNADADVFERVNALLVKDNRSFERRLIAGKDCLIVNGNILMTPHVESLTA